MTELDAINRMLAVIGEAPIDTLSSIQINEITDSALARRTLAEVNRDVQSEGWSWNTDESVEVGATAQGGSSFHPRCRLGSALRSTATVSTCNGLKIGTGRSRPMPLLMTLAVSSTSPSSSAGLGSAAHQAQEYISIRAARIYSDRFTNSTVIFSYTSGDETYARGC